MMYFHARACAKYQSYQNEKMPSKHSHVKEPKASVTRQTFALQMEGSVHGLGLVGED